MKFIDITEAEKINHAIEHIKRVIGTLNKCIPNSSCEDLKLAVRSLQAWEEVLNELENMREIIWQDTDNDSRIVRANAWDKNEMLFNVIVIIKEKLSEVQNDRED